MARVATRLLLVLMGACGGSDAGGPPAPALVITTAQTLVEGTVGAVYEAMVTASGGSGSYTWEVATPPLPGGLTL